MTLRLNRRRTVAPVLGLAAALLLVACRPGAGFGSGAPSDPESASPASASVAPTATASESLGPFACSFPLTGTATVGRAQITDLRVAAHDGYDRIVFEFAAGQPAYTISTATPPLTRDPSGLPMTVAGSTFLAIVLQGGTAVTPDGTSTYSGPSDFTPNLARVAQLVQAGDFEAVSSWYVGLTGTACVRVLTLADPSRLVIDIEH